MEITLNGEKVELHKSNYLHNGAWALQAFDLDGIPYAKLSVNLVDEKLEDDEIAIKTWSENEGFLDQLIEQKVISEPIRQADAEFSKAAICKLLI